MGRWRLGDCIEFNEKLLDPDCKMNYPSYMGDGVCHRGDTNNEECGWEDGDCFWSNVPWRQQGLVITGDKAGDVAGSSVAISGDGNTLAAGAPGNGPGYVKIYYKQIDLSGWNS